MTAVLEAIMKTTNGPSVYDTLSARRPKHKSAMPVPRRRPPVDRAADALRRLGVSRERLEAAAPISELLKRVPGGLKQALASMRSSPDEVISAFLRKYDSIPVGDRERMPIEAIALAASVDPNALLGASMFALHAQGVDTARVIAVTSHPKITAARVKYALMPGGERDRTAIDTMLGWLPSAKSATTFNQAVFRSRAATTDGQEEGKNDEADEGFSENEPDLNRLFPAPRLMQEKLNAIRQRSRRVRRRTKQLRRTSSAYS